MRSVWMVSLRRLICVCLIVALAAAVLVCGACSKKEASPEQKASYQQKAQEEMQKQQEAMGDAKPAPRRQPGR
jgi:hypothetical protein